MFTTQSKNIAQDLEAIDEIATQVSKASERRPPKAYQAQCRSLTERIMVIKEAISGLKVNKSNQGNISQALSALKNTLEEAEELISKLSSESFFSRVFRSDYPAQFTKINNALTENMQQLNLALAVKKIVNPEQDKRDREEDYQALLAQQGEIIAMTRATQQKIELLDAKESKREEVETRREEAEARREEILSQKIASLQKALENLSPTAIVEHHSKQVPEQLRIPFCHPKLEFNGLLAEGRVGKVYRGKFWGQEVAIKVLGDSLPPEAYQEFLREVQIISSLHSDYILPIYAVCDEPERACIVTKYMASGSLYYTLAKKGALLSPRERHQLALDIALGLYYLHGQDIVHRDLNSHNVLVDSAGHACLADFGLSKNRNKKGNIATLDNRSSALKWMAPEVCLATVDWHAFTPQSDIYSYGILLLEIMTGEVPNKDESDDEFRERMIIGQKELLPEIIAPVYRKIIESCCQEYPGNRPANMEGIILTLQNSFPAQSSLEDFAQRQESSSSFVLQNTQPISEDEAEAFYLLGCKRVEEKKYEAAILAFEKAIVAGSIKAKTNLAAMYIKGWGVPPDQAKAHSLFIEAARAGHKTAIENLIRQLKKGADGVPQNIDGPGGALEWSEVLAAQGDEKAKQDLLSLQARKSSNSSSLSSSRLTLLADPVVSHSSSHSASSGTRRQKKEDEPSEPRVPVANTSSSSSTQSLRK